MRPASVLAVVIAASAFVATAAAFEIPLEVKEYAGKGGLRYVSGGVPLLPGQAKETSELTLLRKTADGKQSVVPSQMRVLARWWAKDKSIRWVLVDFQAEVAAKDTQTYVLTDAKLPAGQSLLTMKVEQADDAITIDTGAAKFVVPRKEFTFLKSATIGGAELLDTSAEQGIVVEDMFGQKYFAAAGTKSVEVIENGPLRVRVRARGVNTAPEGKGYSKGMYEFDVFMDFYVGSTTIFADVVLGNNFAKPIGVPTFKDASLWLKLKGGVGEYSILGEKAPAYAGKSMAAASSVCLYQDSNGADTWESCQGYNTERHDYWQFPKGLTATFRGYKVFDRVGEKALVIGEGNRASGTTSAMSANGGLLVHLLNFWQQFPKAVEVFADGRVRVAMFPREYKVPHFLEDATAKGHEIVLHFSGKGVRPDADVVAGVFDSRVYPRPTLEHMAACGALADLGPFTVPTAGLDSKPNNKNSVTDPRGLSDDGLYGNAFGWQIFGEKWRSCGGHSTRGARQPMNEDDYLNRWFVLGEHGWLLAGDARSRQFRDVRSYRIEDQDPFSFKDFKDFSSHNRSEEWAKRDMPKDAECVKYEAGRYPRSTFWLPNPEHIVLDLPYDRYLLMGDQRSWENLPIIAAHGGYFARPEVHRATGWSMRTIYRYWELTGDEKALNQVKSSIAVYRKMVDGDFKLAMGNAKGKDNVNWWFTFVFSRGISMIALHTRDADALEVCKRLAAKITKMRDELPDGYNEADFAELKAVLYHLTGEAKYKEQALGKDEGEALKRVSGGMKSPACAHWLLMQKPEPLK